MDASVRQRIFAAADELTPSLVRTVCELVRIPTVNPYSGDSTAGSELAGQLYMQDRLRADGFATRLFEPPPDVYAQAGMIGPPGRSWKGRPNVVGERTFGAGGRSLVLNCHIDTVGAAGMNIEPFCGEVRDGKIFGRGSSDAKANLVMGLLAVETLLQAGVPLNGRIIFESVVDEECNGAGAGTLACCLAGYRGDAAICFDGSDSNVLVGCNGVATIELIVHGRAGHAATGAVNAIDKARVLADAIDRIKRQRESLAPPMMVNLGVFQAGTIPAVVPGTARLAYNLVYSVAEAEASLKARGQWNAALLREQVAACIDAACAADPWLAEHRPTITWIKDAYPYSTPTDAPIARIVADAHHLAGGPPDRFVHMTAWADACHLSRSGGMPTVGFGVGEEDQAHAAGEFIRIDQLVRGVKTAALAVAEFLSAG